MQIPASGIDTYGTTRPAIPPPIQPIKLYETYEIKCKFGVPLYQPK